MKRSLALVASLALVIAAAPAGAERSSVPKRPNIVDIAGDANLLTFAGLERSTPVQIAEADILAAWLTNDARTITAHWYLSAAPSAGEATQYILDAIKGGSGGDGYCLFFTAMFRIKDVSADRPYIAFTDSCENPDFPSKWWMGSSPEIRELPDGTAIVSGTFPREFSRRLKTGTLLDGLRARSYFAHTIGDTARPLFLRYDLTPVGRDYRIR